MRHSLERAKWLIHQTALKMLERQILHDRIIVRGHFERVIVSLNVHGVPIVHVVAPVLVCAAAPLDRNGQLDKIALLADGVELPLVAVSEQGASHQWQNRFGPVDARQNPHLAIRCIPGSLRADVDWHGNGNGAANVHAAVIAQGRHVRIQKNVFLRIRHAVIGS